MVLNYVDYVYVSYGISCWDRYLEHQKSKKKHEKGPYSRDKKIAIICKACGKEMPNGTEIMSMFPTESAVELDT